MLSLSDSNLDHLGVGKRSFEAKKSFDAIEKEI